MTRCKDTFLNTSNLHPPGAKKSLGQNFLRDANIARRIVAVLDIQPEDQVLEIGPGPGALTRPAAGCGPKHLVLVEKDEYWAAERAADFGLGGVSQCISGVAPSGMRVSVFAADALRMPWEQYTDPWKFLGNLPYNIASPLLWELFSRAPGLVRAVFMVQKEVGFRITAKPGTGAYGALSVWLQSYVRPRLEFIVPPHVFHPKPKVDSAVLSFTPLPATAGTFPPERLASILHLCFQKRRKQLGTILKSVNIDINILKKMDIDPMLRPENLTPEVFQRLASASIFDRGD